MMDEEVRLIYYRVVKRKWEPRVDRVFNGLWHIDFYGPTRSPYPAVLREPGRSFGECQCCVWRVENE